MSVDKRLSCASEVSCPPLPPASDGSPLFNQAAHAARVAILVDLGVDELVAHKVSRVMVERGIVFLSANLAAAIREIVFPAEDGNGKAVT